MTSDRPARGESDAGRPWLQNPEWASRGLVYEWQGKSTPVRIAVGCLVTFFGFVFLIVYFGSGEETETAAASASGPDALAYAGLLGILAVGIPAGLWIARRARRRVPPPTPYRVFCHLETLPGVIGGRFKAVIETQISVERLGGQADLSNVNLGTNPPRPYWRHDWTLSKADVTTGRFPLECHIPADIKHIPIEDAGTGVFARGRWLLNVSIDIPGGYACNASFSVPVYATRMAPPQEQSL